MKRWIGLSLLLLLCPMAALAADQAVSPGNDYPTEARADYVFACMNANGGSRDTLQRCSCSIDVIASILPFSGYEEAETVLRMRQGTGGYLAQEFRISRSNEIIGTLREAQAEAEVRCF